MKNLFIFLLLSLLNLTKQCGGFNQSPRIQIDAKLLDSISALKQAAEVLNVAEPGKISFY